MIMKKIVLAVLALLVGSVNLFAGDVATFVDCGFSTDGKYYVFGQYGKTDKKFQGWADIYQVDIEKNDYVSKGVFKIKPSAVTSDKTGLEVYESLEAKNYYYLKDLNCEKPNADQVLYILEDIKKTGTDEIVFTDFRSSEIENQDTYHINLIPTVKGSGKNVKSSFYILLEKKDAAGNIILNKNNISKK